MLIQRENDGNYNYDSSLINELNANDNLFNPFGYINNNGIKKFSKKLNIIVPIDPEVWSNDLSSKSDMKINFTTKSFVKIVLYQSAINSLKDCLQQINRRLSHFPCLSQFKYTELLSINDGSPFKTLFQVFQHENILAKPYFISTRLSTSSLSSKNTFNPWPRTYVLVYIRKIMDRIPDLAFSICWSEGPWDDNYLIHEKLGEGSFAIVNKCEHKSSQELYALKIIHSSRVSAKKEAVLDEIRMMQAICWSKPENNRAKKMNEDESSTNYHCLVEFYECFVNEQTGQIGMLLELAIGGDLFEEITRNGHLTEIVSCFYMQDICNALTYLHQKQIVHRDIKPENFLVFPVSNGVNRIKLTDFGLATEINPTQTLSIVCGTPTYMAPEIFDRSYGIKIDNWAAGIILYAMLVGYPPFNNNNDNLNDMITSIKSGKYEFHDENWINISDDAKNLIQSLLIVNVNNRMSSITALKHIWFKQIFNSLSENSFSSNHERNHKLSFRVLSKVLCRFLKYKICY